MALLPWFRALHIATTVLIGGAFAFEILILRRCREAASDPAVADVLDRWFMRQCVWAVALALVSWAGWLAANSMSMSGLPAAQAITPEVIDRVMERTTFGHVWFIRLVLFIVIGVLLFAGVVRSKLGRITCAVASMLLVASLGWTGHALGTNRIHVWVDALHLLAATVWLGMLPLLWLVTARAVAQPAAWGTLGVACAKSFFLPGAVAVGVLAASGVANTAWMIDSPADLGTTGYGRVLSMKIGLFALMLVLAAVNRFVIVPRVERGGDAEGPLRSLRASVRVELLLGAAVLAVVAWLGVTPPIAHEPPAQRVENR